MLALGQPGSPATVIRVRVTRIETNRLGVVGDGLVVIRLQRPEGCPA